MAPLAFGIVFGNKDTGNWTKFWEFVKEIHPSVNAPTITIVTDQDKGSISAISKMLPEAHQFHCSYHRHQKIIKACGGHGKTALTALWMYNLLCWSNSLSQLHATQEKYYHQMHPTDHHYITKIDDQMQFPAARCSKHLHVRKFSVIRCRVYDYEQWKWFGKAEGCCWHSECSDKFIQLEGKRCAWWNQQAWNSDQLLPDRGMAIMEEAFKDVYVRDSALKVVETKITLKRQWQKMWWTPRTTLPGCPRKRDLVQGLGAATVGSRPMMASLASIWSY